MLWLVGDGTSRCCFSFVVVKPVVSVVEDMERRYSSLHGVI